MRLQRSGAEMIDAGAQNLYSGISTTYFHRAGGDVALSLKEGGASNSRMHDVF